jgi:hypothetical protein
MLRYRLLCLLGIHSQWGPPKRSDDERFIEQACRSCGKRVGLWMFP